MSEKLGLINKKYIFKAEYNYYIYWLFRLRTLLLGRLLHDGLKLRAYNSILLLNNHLKVEMDEEPFWVSLISSFKIMPCIFLRTLSMGRKKQSIPIPITEKKQATLVMKWTVQLLKDKDRVIKIPTLASLLINAYNDEGLSVDKKEKYYTIASENRYLLSRLRRRKIRKKPIIPLSSDFTKKTEAIYIPNNFRKFKKFNHYVKKNNKQQYKQIYKIKTAL